jgi:hypothetical protein
MSRGHGSLLIAMLLAACSGADVAQQSSDEPEGMVRILPPDGESIGKMHNEALAWVLADLQNAKRRLGSQWGPEMLREEATRSESRFLKKHPTLNWTMYYQFKFDRLAERPLTASPLDQLDSAGAAMVHSVEVASTMYWTAMGNEWSKLLDGAPLFTASQVLSSTALRIIKADIYGAAAGWIVGGPSGAVTGAIVCSLVEAIVIVVERYMTPPAGSSL